MDLVIVDVGRVGTDVVSRLGDEGQLVRFPVARVVLFVFVLLHVVQALRDEARNAGATGSFVAVFRFVRRRRRRLFRLIRVERGETRERFFFTIVHARLAHFGLDALNFTARHQRGVFLAHGSLAETELFQFGRLASSSLGFTRLLLRPSLFLQIALVSLRRERVGLFFDVFFDLFQPTIDVAQLASLSNHLFAHLLLKRRRVGAAVGVVPSPAPTTARQRGLVIAHVLAHIAQALFDAFLLFLRQRLLARRALERLARLLGVGAHERGVAADIVR